MQKLFILFMCTATCAFGQPDPSDALKFKRFSVGINFSPDIAYRKTHKDDNISAEQWENQQKADKEMYAPRLGFSTGGHVSYNLTKRFSIESGVQFSLKGFRQKPLDGIILYDGNVLFKGEMKQHYNFNFIDVPLSVNFVLLDRRLQIVATSGFTWNHMRHSSIKQFVREEVNDEFVPVLIFNTPYRENTFSYTVGLGIQYNFNNLVFLKAVPTFRYAILPIETNLAKSASYWNAGLNVSCSFRLF